MPLTKAQGKRLRLGESGGDRPAERRFTAPHSSVQCATVDRVCPGCKVCSSQKSSCAMPAATIQRPKRCPTCYLPLISPNKDAERA